MQECRDGGRGGGGEVGRVGGWRGGGRDEDGCVALQGDAGETGGRRRPEGGWETTRGGDGGDRKEEHRRVGGRGMEGSQGRGQARCRLTGCGCCHSSASPALRHRPWVRIPPPPQK